MCSCVIVPGTGHSVELRLKQEPHTDFAAMSRDHVTEEDIETFTRVQELAAQVMRSLMLKCTFNSCETTVDFQ